MTIHAAIPAKTREELLRALAQQLCVDSVRATAAGGSGHPTSAMSAADLMAGCSRSTFVTTSNVGLS